ncbi:MAG: hypothetical protein AB7S75_05145 [Desulfococcaceae bacterium]
MNVREIENAIQQLSAEDFSSLMFRIEEYRNEKWDRQIKEDYKAGRLNILKQNKGTGQLTPYPFTRQLSSEQVAARERTLARMKKGFSLGGQCPDRESLHER